MLRSILLGLGALTLAAAPTQWDQDGAPDPLDRGITVRGHGSAVVVPDLVSVELQVEGRGDTLPLAHGAFAERRAALGKLLEDLGNPETRSLGVAVVSGHRVEERIVVTMRAVEGKVDNVLGLIGRAEELSAAEYDGAGIGVAYFAGEAATREARERAVAAAMDDARVRAQALATASGVKIGPVEAVRVVEPFAASSQRSGRQERGIGLEIRFRIAP